MRVTVPFPLLPWREKVPAKPADEGGRSVPLARAAPTPLIRLASLRSLATLSREGRGEK